MDQWQSVTVSQTNCYCAVQLYSNLGSHGFRAILIPCATCVVRLHQSSAPLLHSLQTHIIEVALQEGRRFLHEGEHALAIPAALEALKFLTELHGGAHIQLTPAYLILAEAAIGRCS